MIEYLHMQCTQYIINLQLLMYSVGTEIGKDQCNTIERVEVGQTY